MNYSEKLKKVRIWAEDIQSPEEAERLGGGVAQLPEGKRVEGP